MDETKNKTVKFDAASNYYFKSSMAREAFEFGTSVQENGLLVIGYKKIEHNGYNSVVFGKSELVPFHCSQINASTAKFDLWAGIYDHVKVQSVLSGITKTFDAKYI